MNNPGYADYLHEQGDPRGEFIQTQLALEDPIRKKSDRKQLEALEQELLQAYQRQWLSELSPFLLGKKGSLPDHVLTDYQYRFHRGWIDSLKVHHLTFEFTEVLAASPYLHMLRDFQFGRIDWEPRPKRRKDIPIVEGYLAFYPFEQISSLPNLRSLDIGLEVTETRLGELYPLIQKTPNLERLRIEADFILDLEEVLTSSLPQLRELTVGGLSDSVIGLHWIGENASLHSLTQLTVDLDTAQESNWDEPIPQLTIDDVQAITRSKHLSNLTYLTLLMCDAGDKGVKEIIDSGLLSRLKYLNLSFGTITDEGAKMLAESEDIHNLDQLILMDNCIGETGRCALEETKVDLLVSNQHPPGDQSMFIPEHAEYDYDDEWE